MGGCPEHPRRGKRRREWDRDARAAAFEGMVRVDDYPNLKLLCWNVDTPFVTRRNAFALYERNWRLVDITGAPEHERAFIDDLAREFGQGVINA